MSRRSKLSRELGTDLSDIPNGGFPPIYLCPDKQTSNDPKLTDAKREYTKHKTAVSIKDILEKRKNITPFAKID